MLSKRTVSGESLPESGFLLQEDLERTLKIKYRQQRNFSNFVSQNLREYPVENLTQVKFILWEQVKKITADGGCLGKLRR